MYLVLYPGRLILFWSDIFRDHLVIRTSPLHAHHIVDETQMGVHRRERLPGVGAVIIYAWSRGGQHGVKNVGRPGGDASHPC